MKVCKGPCGEDKPVGEFARKLNGLQPICKSCDSARQRAYREKKRDNVEYKKRNNEANARWKRENPERHKAMAKRAKDKYLANPANKEKAAATHRDWCRKRMYGISTEEYQSLLLLQGGHCAICPNTATLGVDHCHKTGTVRGILCRNCNLMLGHAMDRQQTLEAGRDYLLRFEFSLNGEYCANSR
jgi:hypothetical protein